MKELLFSLCTARGVSGGEHGAGCAAKEYLSRYAEVTEDQNGNLFGVLGNRDGKYHILLDAHLDQIGLIVTQIDEKGFIKAEPCGGIDRRVLQGSPFFVLGKEEIPCVCGCMPPHLTDGGEDKPVAADALWFDTGLPVEQVEKLVAPGDRIVFDSSPKELLSSRVSCAALDNRAGVAVMLRCAEKLSKEKLSCKVTVALTAQEEISGSGARTASFAQYPNEAVVVDVSFARQSGVTAEKSGTMGKGGMIAIAPTLSRELSKTLIALANEKEIPHQLEVMGAATGTNADYISSARGGVKTALISIPLRSMHTQAEVIDLNDIEACAELICAYVSERSAAL